MMQIETIILNTSLIEVAEKSIPGELIKTYNNSTTLCNQNINKLSNNNTQAFEKYPKENADVVGRKRRAGKFLPYFHFDQSRFP